MPQIVPNDGEFVKSPEAGCAEPTKVDVQCRVQARLEGVGDHVTIDGQSSSDWSTREWTPSGVVEWSWTVAADEPVDQRVRLRLRPATFADGTPVYGADAEVAATTTITVRAGRVDRLSHWVTSTAPGITTIVLSVSALLVLVATQGRRVAKAWRRGPPSTPGTPPRPGSHAKNR